MTVHFKIVALTVYFQAVHGRISERFKVNGQEQVDGLLAQESWVNRYWALRLFSVQFSLLFYSLFYTKPSLTLKKWTSPLNGPLRGPETKVRA